MVTFNEAMLSNDRTLAIRVGDFTSENIKSANFKYGYITGDDFTPGGTYAGTASILFTSIVESFKKLDVVYPEIGLLVGSKVEWVKMGKYYIDDIKIDRDANTTEIELMDEMFKLNESFKTDLKYPAQIRDVILEIATKTGVTLASDNFGTTAIQQHVDEPTGDKLTYRDVLSQVSQLLGFSCFFNRNGELEVRGLTESGITITADNYFLHGLEKSEVEYQIAGITCEVANDEKLTVGLQTGRSLEIENPLATQDTLNSLYYTLKDIVYYPYDLSYQGHLKLEVGQWVTIKTNKDEVFKVPVLYQSFSFSGGLTSTISADSVAGSDAQYTYGSFVTKKIDQKSTRIQAEVQQQLKYADEEFKKVSNEMLQQSLEYQNSVRNELATSKAELETQIDTAKTQAESSAKAYADEINQATAEVAEQANTTANSLKSDLAKVKTDLTATTSTANAAKTSASEAKQQLATVANDLSKAKTNLQNAVSAVDAKATNLQSDLTKAKQDLTSQASQLQAQASAQSELTKRVSSVEETANGTKTTVSELSKTVDSNAKNINSVTARTKTVEDDLTSTKTTLSQVKTTADNTSKKTATLETGLNGLTAKFENLQIGTKNILRNTSTIPLGNTDSYNRGTWQTLSGGNGTIQVFDVDDAPRPEITKAVRIINNTNGGNKDIAQRYVPVDFGEQYTVSCWARVSAQSDTDSVTLLMRCWTTSAVNRELKTAISHTEWKRYTLTFTTESTDDHSLQFGQSGGGVIEICGMQLEKGNIVSDYSENDWNLSQKVAEYKQTADQNYASLQSNIQTLDGTVKSNKATADQTAQGFKTRIESLETYKDGETTRANQYFESAKTETARQLTAERTAIAKDYVAKSTYTSDVTGIRNDLTATTTTADTTKTNLANYQASNDKAVANLQSNLQTTDGNVSSLQTKVEAVPGQITSAVSAVEGKIPTNLDSLNLMTGTRDWSTKTNAWHMGANWSTESEEYQGLKVHSTQKGYNGSHQNIFVKNGDIVTFSFFAKATNTLSKIKVSSRWNGSSVYQAPLAGVKESDEQITITSEWKRYSKTVHIISDGSLQFRAEYDGSTIPDGNTFYVAGLKVAKSSLDTGYSENPTDAASDISAISSELKQTKDGMTLLATKTELNTAKSDLQSGITTATNKANAAQSTADSNAKTISTHTTQISALNTGLSAKVSQTDFNTLSGRVTTAENNITAKANELSSKITSVEGQIPSGEMNLVEYGRPVDGYSPFKNAEYATHSFYYNSAYKMYIIKNTATSEKMLGMNRFKVERNTDYTLYFKGFNNSAITHMDVWFLKRVNGSTKDFDSAQILVSGRKLSVSKAEDVSVTFNTGNYDEGYIRFDNNGSTTAGTQADLYFGDVSVKKGKSNNGWSPSLAELASSQDLKNAQSEIKQTTDSIKASVSSVQTTASDAQATANTAVSKADAAQAGVNTLDNTTVKSASLTINTDGIVMKAGKSTTDVANAIGSYFAVNQNAINLFSDKINVKANMIVDGAITSAKIASKSINTAHLNGKIITADVIATNAITADAIKAGAVTTSAMSANSINGDRITAGTLDAAKIKAGSITASQIASGTITSDQIKAGGISAANIATGAITTNHLATGSITADKIAANAIDVSKISGNVATFVTNAINSSTTNTLRITNEYLSISSKSSTSTYSPSIYISPASIQFRGSSSSGTGATVAGVGNTVLINELAIGSTSGIYADDSLRVNKSQSSRLISYGKLSCFDYAGGGLRLSNWTNLGDSYTNDVSIGINEYISASEKYAYMVATKRDINIPNRTYSIRFNSSGTIDLYVKNIYYYGVLEKKK